jgi:hypothetical protein
MTLVGLVETVEASRERGLSGAVLAKKTMELARKNLQRDVVIGNKRAKSLG